MGNFLPLPPGITGFAPRGAAFPVVLFSDFKRLCYWTAQSIGASVSRLENAEGKVTPNFHLAELQMRASTVILLCHIHYPWLAFVKSMPQPLGLLEFRDVTEVAEALQSFPEFRVLKAAYLEDVPDAQLLQELWPGELEQVRYWKPRRLGELIFNDWD